MNVSTRAYLGVLCASSPPNLMREAMLQCAMFDVFDDVGEASMRKRCATRLILLHKYACATCDAQLMGFTYRALQGVSNLHRERIAINLM